MRYLCIFPSILLQTKTVIKTQSQKKIYMTTFYSGLNIRAIHFLYILLFISSLYIFSWMFHYSLNISEIHNIEPFSVFYRETHTGHPGIFSDSPLHYITISNFIFKKLLKCPDLFVVVFFFSEKWIHVTKFFKSEYLIRITVIIRNCIF